RDRYYTNKIAEELSKAAGNKLFIENFTQLLKSFDTGIHSFTIRKDESSFKKKYDIFVDHIVYNNAGGEIGKKARSIVEESTGTQKLFVLAGLVLRALMNGRIIIIDEFERSLHPFITAFIIRMFHEPSINTRGAQLVIATHDTNLLSNSELRRDQIWIVEKDQRGMSSLFSLADINGVRAQIPFEKWYLSGRFGGVPGIEALNFELNYQYEEA
ncbi:MAG: AAA family ATPase, partial [Bacteroidota bacterium]